MTSYVYRTAWNRSRVKDGGLRSLPGLTEREVRLGQTSGEQIEVVSGVQPGDVVVTEGSFFVRAERERLGTRQTAALLTASI